MKDLAHRMAALEEDAFLQFSEIFGPRFRRLFLNKGLSLTDAEDLAVSCVTDIALKVGQYRAEKGNFEAWIFTLARHYLIDWWRHQHPDAQISDDLLDIPLPEEAVQPNFEVVSAITQALERLSDKDQEIIRLKDMGAETSFDDVGRQLGINTGAARVRHLRALERLEKLLEKDERIRAFLEKRSVRVKEV